MVEIFHLNISGKSKLHDEMAISAYIFERVEKSPCQ